MRLDVDAPLVTDLLVRFLRAEAGKFGFSRAVLGLSGGVDSAVSCALAARAFGPENVLAVMMPYRTSNPDSEADARAVAEVTGVRSKLVDISPMVDGYLDNEDVDSITGLGNDVFTWDARLVPPGLYRVAAILDDGDNPRLLVVGGKVEIVNQQPIVTLTHPIGEDDGL